MFGFGKKIGWHTAILSRIQFEIDDLTKVSPSDLVFCSKNICGSRKKWEKKLGLEICIEEQDIFNFQLILKEKQNSIDNIRHLPDLFSEIIKEIQRTLGNLVTVKIVGGSVSRGEVLWGKNGLCLGDNINLANKMGYIGSKKRCLLVKDEVYTAFFQSYNNLMLNEVNIIKESEFNSD